MKKWDKFMEWAVSVVFCLSTIYQVIHFYPIIFCHESDGINWWIKLLVLIGISFATAVVITFIYCLVAGVLFCMWIAYKIIKEINKNMKNEN